MVPDLVIECTLDFSEDLGLSTARRLPDHCSVYQAEIWLLKKRQISWELMIWVRSESKFWWQSRPTYKVRDYLTCFRATRTCGHASGNRHVVANSKQCTFQANVALHQLQTHHCSAVIITKGHCLVGRHTERLKVLGNDFCRSCGEEEEVGVDKTQSGSASRSRQAAAGYPVFTLFWELVNLADVGISQLLSFLRRSYWCNGRG